jgi:hypothetical protein
MARAGCKFRRPQGFAYEKLVAILQQRSISDRVRLAAKHLFVAHEIAGTLNCGQEVRGTFL